MIRMLVGIHPPQSGSAVAPVTDEGHGDQASTETLDTVDLPIVETVPKSETGTQLSSLDTVEE